MKVAFRVDASLQIGTGHVMRCLTLADALKTDHKAETLFICREHPGHLADVICQRGHRVVLLSLADQPSGQLVSHELNTQLENDQPAHLAWLGTDWQTDGLQSTRALGSTGLVDWLIVDHYALDVRWEHAMRRLCRHLMVIDDLADRCHDCDLLLDQNLGREKKDYAGCVPEACEVLVGPTYALLRPEFIRIREASLARRKSANLQHVLITMGGVDKDNATGAVLSVLRPEDLSSDCHITVVMGVHAPHLNTVRQQSEHMDWPTQVLVNVQNMANLMADSDLAIGAAGSTSWERCCLGLPTMLVVLADNQWGSARALERMGAAWLIGRPEDVKLELPKLLCTCRRALGESAVVASSFVDGFGVSRIVQNLMNATIRVSNKLIC